MHPLTAVLYVIANYHLGQRARDRQPLQLTHHPHPAQRGIDHGGQTLTTEVVHYAQDAKAAPGQNKIVFVTTFYGAPGSAANYLRRARFSKSIANEPSKVHRALAADNFHDRRVC
jgi:hypothetical protein